MFDKKPFQKAYVIKNSHDDYDTEQSHQFAFWKDPSKQVIFDLLDFISTTPEKLDGLDQKEKKDLDHKFYSAVSQVVVDCDIAELDFSTPESARESFEHPAIDWRFLYDVIVLGYAMELFNNHHTLKKIMKLGSETANSGKSKNETEETLVQAS